MIDKSLLILLVAATAVQCAVDADRVEHIPVSILLCRVILHLSSRSCTPAILKLPLPVGSCTMFSFSLPARLTTYPLRFGSTEDLGAHRWLVCGYLSRFSPGNWAVFFGVGHQIQKRRLIELKPVFLAPGIASALHRVPGRSGVLNQHRQKLHLQRPHNFNRQHGRSFGFLHQILRIFNPQFMADWRVIRREIRSRSGKENRRV